MQIAEIKHKVRRALAKGGPRLVARGAVQWWVTLIRDALIVARSRLLGVPVVHAIGDSHAYALAGVWPFFAHHLGPVTAYNLASRSSTTQSRTRLLHALRLANARRDIVLLIAGEVDCRLHIYDQHIRSSGELSLEEAAQRTVVRYGQAIQMVKDRGYRVAVQSVVGGAHQGNVYGYPHYAEIGVRGRIVRLFNAELEAWCREHDVDYVDVFSHVTDDRGVLCPSMTSDSVHLNRDALTWYGPWLREAVYAGWVAP